MAINLWFAGLTPRRRLALLLTALVVVLAGVVTTCAVVIRRSSHGDSSTRSAVVQHTESPTRTPDAQPTALNPAQSTAVSSDIALLRSAPVVRPRVSRQHPAIAGDATHQPDLYARAFALGLLTQDYRTPRADLLSWVQSESAQSTEPRVVGLVPEDLRQKFAVYSVTESADGSAVPIPSPTDWQSWAKLRAYTRVQIQGVTESPKWSQAVAAGELTDPGITSRDVTALVVTHWTQAGAQRTAARSVFLSIDMEGPPTRSGYGFVNSVIYRSVPEK